MSSNVKWSKRSTLARKSKDDNDDGDNNRNKRMPFNSGYIFGLKSSGDNVTTDVNYDGRLNGPNGQTASGRIWGPRWPLAVGGSRNLFEIYTGSWGSRSLSLLASHIGCCCCRRWSQIGRFTYATDCAPKSIAREHLGHFLWFNGEACSSLPSSEAAADDCGRW